MLNSIEMRFDALKAEINEMIEFHRDRGYLGTHIHEQEINLKLKELEEALNDWEENCINEQW